MIGWILHSNVAVEVSLNPITWYFLPRIKHQGSTPAYPRYNGLNFYWLFFRVYAYFDDGTINVRAMYEQQEREQQFVSED